MRLTESSGKFELILSQKCELLWPRRTPSKSKCVVSFSYLICLNCILPHSFFCLQMSSVAVSAQPLAKYVPVHRRMHEAASRRSTSPALSDASTATLVAPESPSPSKQVFVLYPDHSSFT
ncbi:hypothetical protein Ac2012v2_006411 [Leucoagaricus gongylophorus]